MTTASTADAPFARYTSVAIALHWIIAALILYQLFVGFFLFSDFTELTPVERAEIFALIQNHKAVGLTVLALSVLRLAWRFWRPAPALPDAMPGWQRALSHASHVALYALMIGLPLTGWAMVSASVEYGAVPTSYFGLFMVPHLPGLAELGGEAKAALDDVFRNAHAAFGFAMAGLFVVHVVAAVKHHVVDGDAVLARMTPGVAPKKGALAPPSARGSGAAKAAAAGLLVVAGAGGAALFAAGGGDVPAPRTVDVTASAPAPAASSAPAWSVVAEESRLGFSGVYGMGAYSGAFSAWRADIRFAADDLEGSRIRVEVDLASVTTGSDQIDGALTGAEYFDVAAHPIAVYVADEIVAGEAEGAFIAKGALTLHGATQPLELPFTLAVDGERATATARVELERLAWGVGQPVSGGHGVAAAVAVEIKVVATKAPQKASAE